MSDDRSAVENLADELAEFRHADTDSVFRESREFAEAYNIAVESCVDDLRAAIEADRAAGWLNPGEARDLTTAYQSEARILEAEVEELRVEWQREQERRSEDVQRAERAEAKLAEVRALAEEWAAADDSTFYGNRLRRVLDQEPVDE